MDLGLVLPLVAFIILAALFIFVLRRASLVFGDTRRAVAFRHDVGEIHEKIDADLMTIASFVSPLRRPDSTLPDEYEIGSAMSAAREAIVWARERVRALVAPQGLDDARTMLMDEFGRADDALRSLDHGFAILSATPSDARAMEGRTAIKRGFLRIVHVRERLIIQSERVAAWRSVGEQGLIARREARSDHRM